MQRGRYLVDRERVGTFPLHFAEGLALGEAMFFCRLAALFAPAWAGEAPTRGRGKSVAAWAAYPLFEQRNPLVKPRCSEGPNN